MFSPDLPGELVEALRRALARTPSPVILIDGSSGTGKSTLATRLVADWPGAVAPVLVRMDDIYPGWGGLDAASVHIRDHLLGPRRAGTAARWQRHDWSADVPAEWHDVDAGAPLIVEGCGTVSRDNAALADLRLWLTADPEACKARALARDKGSFDAHWDDWQRQFDRFVARERPESRADLRIEATDWPPVVQAHFGSAGLTW
ncbi:MAG: hypothetical protein QOF36_1446 [Microbacteriaceae bacterium]|nr:hypothetical protein [Microbacteriaceae bacterium]